MYRKDRFQGLFLSQTKATSNLKLKDVKEVNILPLKCQTFLMKSGYIKK